MQNHFFGKKRTRKKMAFLSKSASLIFLTTALCFLLVVQLQPNSNSDCNMGSGCFFIQAAAYEKYNRKLLISTSGEGDHKVVLKNEVAGSSTGGGGGGSTGTVQVSEGWELREAPLGPDPLHHHGGSPRKPKTP